MIPEKSFSSVKEAFRKQNTGASNYYPFHQIPANSQAVIRFLPDLNPDNPMGFLVEKVMHKLIIAGELRNVPCLSTFGESCPVCATSQQFYKQGDEENGKKYWKKKMHLGQAIIISDPLALDSASNENNEGKILYISLGFQLFGIVKAAFDNDELDAAPWALKGGYNFTIRKQLQGGYPNYALGSGFARKATDLTEQQILLVEQELIDLSTLLPQNPGLEKVEELLNAALTGGDYQDDSPFSTNVSPTNVPSTKTELTSTPESTSTPEATQEEKVEDDTPNADDLLARIRLQRQQREQEAN